VPLTCSTPLDEILRVFIHGWPEKSTLPDFCMSAECPIMSSIWWWVASFNDLDSFFSWYTPFEESVWANSKEVRLIPYMVTTLINELSFVLS
jgi:hypothetical protein